MWGLIWGGIVFTFWATIGALVCFVVSVGIGMVLDRKRTIKAGDPGSAGTALLILFPTSLAAIGYLVFFQPQPAQPVSPHSSSYSSGGSYAGTLSSELSLRRQAAERIRGAGFWCERATDVSPALFGQSANRTTVRVFCEGARGVANYEMELNNNTGRIVVKER